MPRKPRQASPSSVYHWITRGVNKKQLFHNLCDYRYYYQLLLECALEFDTHIHHYCLMPNHVHLLLRASELNLLSKFSHCIARRYAFYYSSRHNWEGQVFQRSYKSLPVENDSYLLECGRYIERNPVRAKIVEDPAEYAFSSYARYAFSKTDKLIITSPAYLDMAKTEASRNFHYRRYVTETREYEKLIGKWMSKI